jgi:hypothetical protein
VFPAVQGFKQYAYADANCTELSFIWSSIAGACVSYETGGYMAVFDSDTTVTITSMSTNFTECTPIGKPITAPLGQCVQNDATGFKGNYIYRRTLP